MKTELIKIFVASPSDLESERLSLKDTADELNSLLGNSQGFRCEFVGWENNTFSALGEDAQDVINNQIDEDYHLFICLLWSKLGTPTGRANSGTVEEYQRALARYKEDKNSVNIGVYIKQDAIPRSMIKSAQFDALEAFIDQSRNDGQFTKNFESNNFEKFIRKELTASILDILQKIRKKKESHGTTGLTKPLIELDTNESDQDEELMLLDYREILDDSLAEVNVIIGSMTEGLVHLANQMEKRSQAVATINNQKNPSVKLIKNVLKESANDFDSFSNTLEHGNGSYNRHFDKAVNALNGMKMYYLSHGELDEATSKENDEALSNLSIEISESKSSLNDFRDIIDSLPVYTSYFSKAKKRLLRNIDILVNEFENNIGQIERSLSS